MKGIVANTLLGQFLERGSFDFATKHFRNAKASIIEQDD